MGLLFLFLVLSGTVDVIRLILPAAGKILNRRGSKTAASPRQLFVMPALLALAIYGYGLFEAADLRLEQIEIASPKITAKHGRIRIAQISDVHLGFIVREDLLGKVLAKIKGVKPDILVSTGDLLDGQTNNLTPEAQLLAAFNPPLGKIAITGNHEFYAGLQDALAFTKKSGFSMLRQKGMTVGGINFAGVDDPAVDYLGKKLPMSEQDVLATLPKGNFTVLLKHRPVIDPKSLGLFDLQLSGHTHKGQIFPFNLVTWLFYPERAGELTRLSSGFLYLSRGTGTWGPPIRFLSPPQVTIIDLVPAK